MSEKLDQWKAREEIRDGLASADAEEDYGFIGLGLQGILALALAAVDIFTGEGVVRVPSWLLLLVGIALVAGAVGLWYAKSWARWLTVALCASLVVLSVSELGRASSSHKWGFSLVPTLVYLILPSTGRSIARARGRRTQAQASPPGPRA